MGAHHFTSGCCISGNIHKLPARSLELIRAASFGPPDCRPPEPGYPKRVRMSERGSLLNDTVA
jgi:hypothetical protein